MRGWTSSPRPAAGSRPATGFSELPDADVVVFGTSPGQVLALAGHRLPARVVRPLRRWKHGRAAYQVDLAVHGGIPWIHDEARRGTVHVGGTLEDIVVADRNPVAARMPRRPFVLVCQQYLADPSRSVGDVPPVWATPTCPRLHRRRDRHGDRPDRALRTRAS